MWIEIRAKSVYSYYHSYKRIFNCSTDHNNIVCKNESDRTINSICSLVSSFKAVDSCVFYFIFLIKSMNTKLTGKNHHWMNR